MEKWQKIEEFINRLLEKFYTFLSLLVLKFTPNKIKHKVIQSKKAIKHGRAKVKETLVHSKTKPKQVISLTTSVASSVLEKLILLSTATGQKLKSFKKGEILLLIGAMLSPLLYKSKSWWIALRPEQIVISVIGSAVFGLTTIGIVTSTKQMAESQEQSRSPASQVEEQKDIRPKYYKLDEKRFKIVNIQVPIYVGKSKDLKTLQVDFTFISSNQYITEILLERENLVYDRLNTMVEPIMPEFFLEDEGKRIMKEKIKYELNELLDIMGVEGEIQEVHIDTMLAT